MFSDCMLCLICRNLVTVEWRHCEYTSLCFCSPSRWGQQHYVSTLSVCLLCVAPSVCVHACIWCHGGGVLWLVCHGLLVSISAAVTVDSSHMTASSSALWSRFSPPSYSVNWQVLTVWFMVCHWPRSQECDWARPHFCKLAQRGPWPVWKWFIIDHVWRGRSKPGCRIVGSVTIVWLTTEFDDQSSLHCVTA